MKKVLLLSSCSDRPGAAQWLPRLSIQSSRLGQSIVFEVSTISFLKRALLIPFQSLWKTAPVMFWEDWMRTVSIAKAQGPCVPRRWCYLLLHIFRVLCLWSPFLHVPRSPWDQKSWCESPFAQKSASLGTWPVSLSMFLLVKHLGLLGTLLNGSNLNHILKPWIVLFQTNKRFSPRD